MLECPYCYRAFRVHPEQIGSRCPKCRMPLFERVSSKRKGDRELGPCPLHGDAMALVCCARCQNPMCATCRTRWHDEVICPPCVDRSIHLQEPSPQEAIQQFRKAWLSFGFSLGGWFVLLLAFLLMLFASDATSPSQLGVFIFLATCCLFASLFPALLAVGQAASAVRLRGQQVRIATLGLTLSSTQIGLTLGLLLVNFWHN